MKYFLMLFTCLSTLLAFDTMAQGDNLFTINPGETISQSIPEQAQYLSKNFVKGQAWFKDGKTGSVLLNYNWLYDEMLFINEKGDTLAFANPEEFKMFALNNDTFYFFDNQYFQKLGTFGDLQLAEKAYLGIVDVKKIGAMGTETSTVSTDLLKRISLENTSESKNLVMQEKTIVKKVTQYFIGNLSGIFKPATKKNIQKMATESEWKQLEKYLKSNNVSFYKKEDLVGLLTTLL